MIEILYISSVYVMIEDLYGDFVFCGYLIAITSLNYSSFIVTLIGLPIILIPGYYSYSIV